MLEPTVALRKALGDHLAADPAVAALVDPANIRDGEFRPEELPAILFGPGNVEMRGRANGGHFVARVTLDLHIWAIDDGLDTAQAIGAAVAKRLLSWPNSGNFHVWEFKHTRTVWPRDPNPNYGHGVMSVEAVICWKI